MNTGKVIAAALLVLASGFAAAQSAIDGTWMVMKEDKSLDPGSLVTFKVEREAVSMSTVSGVSYKARLTGADAPVEGDVNVTSVSVTMPRKNVLVEISKRDGKAWLSTRIEVEPDGKTARVTWKNLKTDKAGSYELSRQ